jgi:hypothetical protein
LIFDGTVPRPNFSDFLCRKSKKFENHWLKINVWSKHQTTKNYHHIGRIKSLMPKELFVIDSI